MKKFLNILLLLTASTISLFAQDNARPWSFWYWMYGAVTKPAIKADLEGMKRVGLQGTYLMPIRGVNEKPEYEGKAQQLTPAFWDYVSYAMHISDSLNLQLGVHICDGFALAGGPWFTPEESMQRIVENGGTPIAAFAIPTEDTVTVIKPIAMTHSDNITTSEKCLISAKEDCWFTFDFGKMVNIRNVEVIPSGTNFQCQRLKVEASEDGVEYEHLKDFIPARQGWQNYLYNMTYALPYKTDTKGNEKQYRYYRFTWSPKGTEPGSEDLDAAKWKATLKLKVLVFHHDARLDQWEGKAGYAWRVSKESTEDDIPKALCIPKDKLIPLKINADGSLDLSNLSKKQTYKIIRIGHESTGMTNATAGGGKGLECDKFSKTAVNKLIDNWFCKFDSIEASITASPDGGSASFGESPHINKNSIGPLSCLHVDSWECGCQNWSDNFADEFKKRRGYDLMPWLPVMLGIPVESAKETERVLRDVRLTINDLLNDVFFATVRDRAHEMGMLFSSESVAPTMICDGLDHYKYADLPMGEFWLNSPTHDKPNDMLDAISGAHIYGKNIVQAEGFTEVRGVWNETPQSIKKLLDRNLSMGMNRLFFHVNAHNPWLDRRPGMTLDGIGLFFQRDQIWYDEARPFVDYVTRCCALLQQGRPVVDVAVYNGDEMPRRSVLPERLVPMLPGIFGANRVASEKKRLANVGQPSTESPVGVYHSSGITDTRDWVNPLRGYKYDSFNADVLLNYTKAENREMFLDGGMKYSVVVVPQERPMNPNNIMSEASRKKIQELKNAGVAVIESTYAEDDFSKFGVIRDVTLDDSIVDYIAFAHRSAPNAEIYFLSNQRDTPVNFTAKLRNINGIKYIYDPVYNTYTIDNSNDNNVNISLFATGSCFVILTNGDINDLFKSAGIIKAVDITETVQSKNSQIVAGPYNLYFQETGKEETLDTLRSWTESDDIKEKYFSGHCTYTTSIKLKKPQQYSLLSLGDVRDIAHVWVNDVDCGIIWTYPHEVYVGNALKKGNNKIKIEVVNTWYNALRGMDESKAPYEGIWTNAKYRAKTPYLLPAGLLGPVILKASPQPSPTL